MGKHCVYGLCASDSRYTDSIKFACFPKPHMDKLRASRGEVELENVPLRRDALRFFYSSLEVRSGVVGKIKLKIPMSTFRSEPWSITMERIYLVIGPQRFENFDSDVEESLEQELKLAALDGIEEEWRAEQDSGSSGYQPSYSSLMSFGTSFIGSIIDNLQIHLSEIHVRYEDDISIHNQPFACGFFIQTIGAETCDELWNPRFIQRDTNQVNSFKLVELQNVAMYLKLDAEMFGDQDIKDLPAKMKFNIHEWKRDFILKPVSATATVKRNCSEKAVNAKDTPRVTCSLKLTSVPLEISRSQYQRLFLGSKNLHQLHRNKKFWKWKPSESVHENPVSWWQYAIICHLEEIQQKSDVHKWNVVLKKARENVVYVKAFQSYLDNPVGMDQGLKIQKESMDHSRSLSELRALREISVERLRRQKKLDSSATWNGSYVAEEAEESGFNEKVDIDFEGSFEMPKLTLDLKGDVVGQNALVSVTCNKFALYVKKDDQYKFNLEIALKDLVMEDLQVAPDCKHRLLMTSETVSQSHHTGNQNFFRNSQLSTSCPEKNTWIDLEFSDSCSLPDNLDLHPSFVKLETSKPETPNAGSSPVYFDALKKDIQSEDNLIHIKVTYVEDYCPEFVSKYNSTNRFVDVDFNHLDINFNMQTWVVVFDFFGIGSKMDRSSNASLPTDLISGNTENLEETENFNTEINVKVRALAVLFNKTKYEVANAAMKDFDAKILLRDGDFLISGKLGNFCVQDLTSHGSLYYDRFLSRGENILTFHVFKYGTDDEKLEREYDALVKLRMSSIMYVHTHRFYSELQAYFNEFHQLQGIMNRARDAAAGEQVSELGSRGKRIKLDVEAGSPLLLIPMSSFSSEILAVDLGHLEIKNVFKFSGDPGTISSETLATASNINQLGFGDRSGGRFSSKSSVRSRSTRRSRHVSGRSGARSEISDTEDYRAMRTPSKVPKKCLLDVLNVKLKSADLKSAERLSAFTDKKANDVFMGSFIARLGTKSILKKKFEIKLQIERNLDKAICHRVPDLSVNGTLSKIHAKVDLNQYKFFRGLLAYNFGEPMEDLEFQTPTNEFTDPNTHTILTGNIWTGMFMDFELQDVVIDAVYQHEKPSLTKETGLAQINLFRSRLIFESFSDGSRDVDLVSQEILLNDLRFKDCPANMKANVFTKILQPMTLTERKSPLQAEVHYRSTQETNRFTILVNNMKLMGIFDWWIAVLHYIGQMSDNPHVNPLYEGYSHAEVNTSTKTHQQEAEPLYPSAGFISRRAPMVESKGPVFELKLNVTDSEFVIAANPSQLDSSLVILRSTTVLAYRPDLKERPFSCNLNNAEMFSCILGREAESALSIIDPVTINCEIAARPNPEAVPKGLLDLTETEMALPRVAEIQLQQLNLRLSYHDWMMFKDILKSFADQATAAVRGITLGNQKEEEELPANVLEQVEQLQSLGFTQADCIESLKSCSGNIEEAALWLTKHCSPIPKEPVSDPTSPQKHQPQPSFFQSTPISFSTLELKTSSVNLFIIDDCKDADVPLMEMTLSHLHLKHSSLGNGDAYGTVSGSYYNRALSAWEPYLEPWNCNLDWKLMQIGSNGEKVCFNLTSSDTLNFNLTSTLLDLYQIVKSNWFDNGSSTVPSPVDDERSSSSKFSPNKSMPSLINPNMHSLRNRVPFVPYAIVNKTGIPLFFCTRTKTSGTKIGRSRKKSQMEVESEWKKIEAEEVIPFSFEVRSKVRQIDLHDQKVRQIIVRGENFQDTRPLSVDRVGSYFRMAKSMPDISVERPPARLVFDIVLDGSAKKLITLRSALLLKNSLPVKIVLKLENTAMKLGDMIELELEPRQVVPMPLSYVWARIFAKPVSDGKNHWTFCEQPINWYHILTSADSSFTIHGSKHEKSGDFYKFAVSVRRLNFPEEDLKGNRNSPNLSAWIQPAHFISFLPPIRIVNLLPCHLHFFVVGSKQDIISDVSPGEEVSLAVNIDEQTVLRLSLDEFPGSGDLILTNQPASDIRIRLTDHHNRPLFLYVKVELIQGGAIKVTIYSPIWLVNKTGLPLIFKQEGLPEIAAGQAEEHEVARMATPLMFSFTERDSGESISMRIGNILHPDGKSTWCKHFYIQTGPLVRRLRVCPSDNRVEWVYIVGIETRNGKGRYRDTKIVTLAPRFQIYNQSHHTILFSQSCFASTFQDPGAEATHLKACPQSSLSFHWPRLDRDQLLCLKLLDIPDCQWSGGFLIDSVDSLHATVRNIHGRGVFVRMEISLFGATFSVVITDACTFPSPFRIDNFSEVSLNYYQTGVQEEFMRSLIKPRQSVPYALDEPTLPAHLTCIAPGGSTSTYNMNVVGEGSDLTYENFIYVAMTATFYEDMKNVLHSEELVLDVEGTKVFLAKKEAGKRSQLWRMTSTGMLQHEGSTAPRDPRKSNSDQSLKNALVLDIAAPAVQPKSQIPLILRKYDERRQLTQRWKFAEDGRLMTAHQRLFVQAKDGFRPGKGISKANAGKWQIWNEVVLGPDPSACLMRMPNGIPIEQAIERQKLRPGSGFLNVKVVIDGPTRVIQITDAKQKSIFPRLEEKDWLLAKEDGPGWFNSRRQDKKKRFGQRADRSVEREFQIVAYLKGGIGLSLVSQDPNEELLYCFMSNLVVDYQHSALNKIFDGSVQDIQIDNQLHTAQVPVILFLSPSNKSDDHRHMPAIHLTYNKLCNHTENSEIYKHLIVTVKNMTLTLEEELLCKVLKFADITKSDREMEKIDESAYDAQKAFIASTTTAVRYYFGHLKMILKQVKLSVLKCEKLSPELEAVKKKLGLLLITFEDANVELKPFVRTHMFETISFLTNSLISHYHEELLSQAILILGSTDFLGNPIGFLHDLQEGVSGLVSDGNVGGLLKNVAHGAANSTAKVAGTLSTSLGRATLHEQYDERRLMIKKGKGERSKEHLLAGIKGLGYGVLGGMTSVITETYDGVAQDGIHGLFSGLGWGLVGTITKPAIGVLDLATGAATAVKESSRGSHKLLPRKLRPSRLVGSPMLKYSESDARKQELRNNEDDEKIPEEISLDQM